ncbi:uncharacterized protein LOC109423267 [Aedes albopictus]|uniref:Secreted protein n=1 Tax=Aedes albopictus TaxID=7160 RepID=A0ABM1Y677_AEDAL
MILLLVLISVVGSAFAHPGSHLGHHNKYVTLDNVKYSYGIFAPVGVTVGAYVWFISALGLILGALVLLYFSKGWRSGSYYSGIFGRRSLEYQRTFGENSIFDDLNPQRDTRSHQLFWKDRIRDIAKLFKENY